MTATNEETKNMINKMIKHTKKFYFKIDILSSKSKERVKKRPKSRPRIDTRINIINFA